MSSETPNRTKKQKTYTLSPDTLSYLERVGNASGYLDTIVQQRWQDWTDALEVLREAGWGWPELATACDVLNGTWLHGIQPGPFLAAELHDGQALNKTATEKWEVQGERWLSCVEQVRGDERIATALRICVLEFWADNEEFERRAQQLGET